MSHHYGGRAHRCHAHGLPNCSRAHQSVPYVRPESPHRIGEWQLKHYDYVPPRNPWRVLWAIVVITAVTAMFVAMAVYAGRGLAAASDPTRGTITTPSPHPEPPS